MPKALTELKTRWDEFARRTGLKSTRQRDLIVDEFLRADGHISIEELLARVRRKSPRVGYVTVYRTLKLLADAELAVARQFGDGQSRFERADGAARPHHDHLICTECGRILEFENPEIERLQELVAQQHGFEVVSHKLEIYGRCLRGRGCRSHAKPARAPAAPRRVRRGP
ncbi:MAG TPA: transcriptional repressor [Polyangia bacterium]|jgi:Fur family ferric uptake transcriptional regulator